MSVDDYIKKQPSIQKDILRRLRKLILKAAPGIVEEMKMGVPWYEGKFYLVSLRNHVNLGVAYNSMLDKYQDGLEGKGKYMRHVKVFSLNDIDERKLVKLMKTVKEGYRDPHPRKK